MRSSLQIQAITALCFFLSLPLTAATVYVGTGGTDSATCGASIMPCKTIQYAVTNRRLAAIQCLSGPERTPSMYRSRRH